MSPSADSAPNLAAAEAPNTIDQVFIHQAQHLCNNGEYLPGGVEGLAAKLQKSMKTNTPLNVKLGLDPTRPDLHLGHTIVLKKLKQFQELGHRITLIIGDATALIGDPSGRNATRPPLTEDEVKINAQTYLDQAAIVLDISKVTILHNSDWLYKIDFPKLLQLCSRVTVAQLLTRDDFNKRYSSQQPISLHELLYPMMQAYDSVAISSDIELGGTDQRFNLLLGRDLQSAYGNEDPQSVLMMPLLEGTDGVNKMSKTYPEHCINLTDSATEMFGKMMSIPDTMIVRYMTLLTTATAEYIALCNKNISEQQVNPRDLKADVAKTIITEFHSQDAAVDAELAFIKQFREKEIPDDIPTHGLTAGIEHPLLDIMITHDMAPSKGEARRLIDGGGVRLNSTKIENTATVITLSQGQEVILQVGKRKFLKLVSQ